MGKRERSERKIFWCFVCKYGQNQIKTAKKAIASVASKNFWGNYVKFGQNRGNVIFSSSTLKPKGGGHGPVGPPGDGPVETDLIMVFKIINGLVDLPMNQFFHFYKSPYTTRRHKFCLAQNISKTEIQKGLFANRIVPVWNKLPNYMFTPNTLSSFTNKLKKLDLCNISNLKF